MGIHRFFPWFKETMSDSLIRMKKGVIFQDLIETDDITPIDNFFIDLNGVFHQAAQEVYKYGNNKPQRRLLGRPPYQERGCLRTQVFKSVCETIENLFRIVNPTKRLILCVDGPAPQSKQKQQRQRRFKSAMESSKSEENNRYSNGPKFDSNCISGDSLVSLHAGRCRPINMLENNTTEVVCLSTKYNSTEYTLQTQFFDQGVKDVITITFQDGRVLTCTPDHQIMTSEGVWINASELDSTHSVVFGVRGVIDIPQKDEKDYNISIGDFNFSMDTEANREKLLAFARINGIMLSDGCSSEYIRKSTNKIEPYGSVTLGSIPDVLLLLKDIELCTGKCMSSTYDDKRSFRVNLPARLSKAINSTGIPIGTRIDQEMKFPNFILDSNCPISVVREFLGGYFGGDGHAPGFGKNKNSFVIRGVKFSHSCREKFRSSMVTHMKILTELLKKIGVESSIGMVQKVHSCSSGYNTNCDVTVIVHIKSTKEFVDKIGFRYCHSKSIRAEAIASYDNLKNQIMKDRLSILENGIYKYTSGQTRLQAYNNAIREFLNQYPVVHQYCLPSKQAFNASLRNGLPQKLNYIRGLSLKQYLTEIGAINFFGDHTGGLDRVENTPVMKLKIIDSRNSNDVNVYDISVVSNSTSFLANGIGVHNCITPGTKFMDHLTKYIDWYIRKRISEDSRWQNVEIIFSNEKVPGEGEHKALSFIRLHDKPDESYCIHGLDSDLIMLTLATKLKKIYILREDQFDHTNEFFCIDIGYVQKRLHDMMNWGEGKRFIQEYAINDFIFLCFLIGNDFLPQMPSIEVWNRGLDMIIEVYKDVCSQYGHITRVVSGNVLFVKNPLEVFLGTIARFEQVMLEEKVDSRVPYLPDELLEQCTEIIQEGEYSGKSQVDVELYRGLYYTHKFPGDEVTISKICHEYLEGMQWVLSYYTKGVPNWKWFYPFHYAPFAHDLTKHVKSFRFPTYDKTVPNLPYQQLLCVLPPKSADLIPSPLSDLLTKYDSPIKHFYPESFHIDVSGKRKEYEGVVILPIIDSDLIRRVYSERINMIDMKDRRRNKHGKSFVYNFDPERCGLFESYYGNIPNCSVNIHTIEI